MKNRINAAMSVLVPLAFLVLAMPLTASANICFECHDTDSFEGRVVHEPVAEGGCDSCHSPHVARHEGLLLQDEARLCYECHDDREAMMEENRVLHPPVKEGDCTACHNPHAASFSGLLEQRGRELCFSCHEAAENTFAYGHKPYEQGRCDACHDPHGGSDSRLLKRDNGALCLGCHKEGKALKKAHLGKELEAMDCLACHHPHGGQSPSLLREFSHEPFAEGDCNGCHEGQQGVMLCLDCHDEVLSSFNRAHTHLQAAGGANPCVACHNPHVGDRAGMLPANMGTVCSSCHGDTFERRDKALHQHVGWKNCTDCHDLHGSDSPAMFKGSAEEVCASCHEQHTSFTHPVGEGTIDHRNGEDLTCITCHDANAGTMYKHFLRGSSERGLCVQCHKSY